MLNFDSNHKNIEGNLNKNKNKKNIIIGSMLLTSVILFSGCAKDVDCDIVEPHAHNYINEKSFDKYMISEKEYHGRWDRTNDYVFVDDEMKELIKFENKEGLFRISHNKEKISNIINTHGDYKEYRYKYTWMQPVSHTRIINGRTQIYFTYIPHTKYTWTSNKSEFGLTGEERVVHYVYYGYKIVKDENGKYKTVKSQCYDSFEEIPEEYSYIKKDFYKKVHLDNKDKEVDYEDGPKMSVNLNENQQLEYEQQIGVKKKVLVK